ncbi:hypothetical protein Chor_012982 [Crotalus horridus]
MARDSSDEDLEVAQISWVQMDLGHPGPPSPLPSHPIPPRGSIVALPSPGAFSPAAVPFVPEETIRYQPEGSSGASYIGGQMPSGTRSDSLGEPFHARLQPDGSRRRAESEPQEQAGGRPIPPLSLEIGRVQPEGSGYNTPTLRSPVELRPLSPGSGSSSSLSSLSPSMKLSQSPSRGALPDLCALDPLSSGILATVELKDSLPKAESSDHICLSRPGSSHRLGSLSKAISSEYLSGGRMGPSKSAILSKAESEELTSYSRVSTVRMQGVILFVFAKYYHLPFLQNIQTDCTRTGLGGYWGNKGGVSVRLAIFGHMVCFLNCHLPAHMEKAEQRKEDFTTILHLQQFEGPSANGILDHDLVFWFGDLNFRIDSLDIRYVKYAIDNSILHQLWEKDQVRNTHGCLVCVQGAKKRKPAWTDRILWKIKSGGHPVHSGRSNGGNLTVTQLCYCSHMEYTVSDHKPVVSIFAVQFGSRADMPLVEMQVADEWTKPEQAVVRYRTSLAFHRSSWDWIALYRVGFRHCKDYIAYVWAKQEDTDSHLYQISLPTLEQVSSATDSTNSTSEEDDDSTLVLLGPKSRSPSPGKMHRHRSRSPSLAKFQGLLLRSTSRDQGASRSPSPQGRRHSTILKADIPSIQFSKDSPRHRSKSREMAQNAQASPSSSSTSTASQSRTGWRFEETPPSRADPRNLGLLPAVRLETVDRVMGSRRDSTDPSLPGRRMSPTSPTAGLAALFSTSPQEGAPHDPHSHSCETRH